MPAAVGAPSRRIRNFIMSRIFAIVLLTLATASSAFAQSPSRESPDHMRARLLGVLVYTKVTLKFEDTPARDAFSILSKAINTEIVGRYSDDNVGFGIDPDLPINVQVNDEQALEVLGRILEQCEVYEDCTWQLRRGFIEVSTKERLSVPSARELRMYHIRDLMLEPPRFATEAESTPKLGKYGASMLGTPAIARITGTNPVTGGATSERRKSPEALATEIIEGVVEIVEPGKWDWGQEQPKEEPEPGASTPAATNPPPPSSKIPRSAQGMAVWGTIRLWRDQIIVKAPDFMHRQIDGYPRPIRPVESSDGLEFSPRRDSSSKASNVAKP
jgi:hypothetical protein